MHSLGQAYGSLLQRSAGGVGQAGGRGFFNHFLVAPLGRTVALTQRNHLAFAITEQLHLNVAGAFDKLFQKQARVFEVGLGQALHRFKRRGHLGCAADQPHANAAAARCAFEHHRIADPRRLAVRLRQVVQQAATGQQGHALRFGQRPRRVLQAKGAHLCWRGADEGDASVFTGLGEVRVFGQKTVAGVDSPRAGGPRRVQNALRVQVALCGWGRADADAGIGHGDVQRIGVGLGIHGHRAQAQRLQAADHAAGDGAAVGDQNGIEHRMS